MTSSSSANVSPRLPVSGGGTRDEPGQHVRHFHARETRAPVALDDDGEVLAAIRNIRKRMAGIECERREHRTDALAEIVLQEFQNLRRVICRVDNLDLLLAQQRSQHVIPALRDFAAAWSRPEPAPSSGTGRR